MESKSSNTVALVCEILKQIRTAITQLLEWNKDVVDMHDLEQSPQGMQRLAGNCMLIQAIGEEVIKIDKYTDGKLLINRPEIPWKRVMGMRHRISHGYFDIDTGYIDDIIKNDLAPLLEAIDHLISLTEKQQIENEIDEQLSSTTT